MGRKFYTASLEDYLETIYLMGSGVKPIRVTDLAERLKIKKSSVSEAILKLSGKGLVKHERYGKIILTSKGRKLAEKIYSKHKALYRFLTEVLGVKPQTAENDACAMEHMLSKETLNKLEEFLNRRFKF